MSTPLMVNTNQRCNFESFFLQIYTIFFSPMHAFWNLKINYSLQPIICQSSIMNSCWSSILMNSRVKKVSSWDFLQGQHGFEFIWKLWSMIFWSSALTINDKWRSAASECGDEQNNRSPPILSPCLIKYGWKSCLQGDYAWYVGSMH